MISLKVWKESSFHFFWENNTMCSPEKFRNSFDSVLKMVKLKRRIRDWLQHRYLEPYLTILQLFLRDRFRLYTMACSLSNKY